MRRITPILLATLTACAESHGVEPPLQARPLIELPGFGQNGSVFEVPATVTRSTPFQVSYAVFGSSSCTRFQNPELGAGTDFILIIPRLVPIPAGTACTDDLATIRQTVTLTWVEPRSDFRVLLRGYRADGTGVELSRRVLVQ